MDKDTETAADVVLATELDAAVEERIIKAIEGIFYREDYQYLADMILRKIVSAPGFVNAVNQAQLEIDHRRQLERLEQERMKLGFVQSELRYVYTQETTTGPKLQFWK